MEKERRTKALLLSALVIVVATVSIAFAAMSRTLSINGIGKMDTASWSVYFDNLSDAITNGAKEEEKPNINANDKGIIENIKVKLFNPGDEISYKVDIVNDGTMDAEITMIKDVELTDAQKKIFEFIVTYTATGDVVQNGDILPKKTTKNATITIRFKDNIAASDLPTESQIIDLTYQITYTQYDGEVPVGPNGGGVTTEKTVLARGLTLDELRESDLDSATFFNGTIARASVESISFVNNKNVPTEAESTIWDASEAKDESIIGWYQDIDSDELYEVYIGSEGKIYAPSDSAGLFYCFCALEEINLNNFNTSEVTNMSYMFSSTNFVNLDLSMLDTSNVTDMSYMFNENYVLENVDLSSFNTSNVTNMSYMFFDATSIINIDLRNADFSNVNESAVIIPIGYSDDLQIILKDETQKTLFISFNVVNASNIVLASEL